MIFKHLANKNASKTLPSRIPHAKPLLTLSVLLALGGCGDNQNSFDSVNKPLPEPVEPPEPVAEPIPAFDEDGVLTADIRWTDYGVPHITADNLESMSYGVGYAFARDNLCVLADQIVKYNSQRAKFFGPDEVPGSGDAKNLINDFGYLTLGIRELAEQNLAGLSANSRAMFQGYTQGYNQYLADTPQDELDPACAGQPWVTDIDSVDLLTYSLGVALLPGAANFLGPMFLAAPPGEDYAPVPVAQPVASATHIEVSPAVTVPELNRQELGSNGWGLGSDKTENGMGMVLANPHFPHTGNLRFWQFHTTVPGHLNVMGGSLSGLPGAVNIGFNENVAWTHTFSTAEHFVVYQLQLDSSDSQHLTHKVDGSRRTIYSKDLTIEVATGPGSSITMGKKAYYTNYGPIIEVPGSFDWSETNAFAIKDANLPNFDVVDHWLAMNMAGNMEEFKQAFKDYDGVIFNNTMAASREGEVFYIDDSTVPHLTSTAINELTTNPLLIGIKQQAGFTVLPGYLSAFDYNRPVPYELAPKYEGTDSVQNSNDSFWLTNLDSPITGVSPLYGKTGNQQSLRSRLGQIFMQSAGGSDGKFNPVELEDMLVNNQSFLANEIKEQLLAICEAQGGTPVDVDGTSVSLVEACSALALWDGTMNTQSVGAHLFREFAFQFAKAPQWQTPFDPEQPVATPSGLLANDTTLMQLATAVKLVNDAGIEADATLGQVQFVERSLPDGSATGVKLPWGGAHNIEGGFNVFNIATGNNGTLLPRHTYAPLNADTILSAEGKGYHINYGSSWMMVVNFTEDGPKARGLLSYSQNSAYGKEHSQDQTELYSQQPQLRDIVFTEQEIAENTLQQIRLSSQ
ncbi:acylase [Alteromonas aestuariivivens]|uniref:Acylase n=1 Tax=Alteromonas aestuariivivens TaxID=1938339 RepID=A0A3D8M8N0_9ALTE|nr:acylase [Alteromonas aestuariivivens]RDV26038.1 acylase [Alteromonas aestuariivivens]